MALKVPKPTARISMLYVPPDFHALLVNRSPLSIVEIRFFGKQLVAGLSYIHKAGIRQCDLKPENVLVDRGMQLKIIVFRLSEDLFVRSDWTAGMPGYWVSEVLKGKVHADKIDVI
ncbi:kinase-like protein [Linnemannia elongata AG-77]|uniref:non-specific serine/threonine protein kinase n=1 Tax=Linnemannia elongata AG-77 TaxID=1314771 RepID=A0A197KAX7_9FUNG|nr:kinase-like protein [Linnemannia elongata AG-77]